MATQDPLRPQGLIAAGAASKTPVAGFTAATAAPTKATSTGYDPAQVQVRDFETVQGQLDKVIAKDSPLMQQAARRANQAANSRGLLNSSMAVGAAQDAVIQSALPIAQQDAQTIYDSQVRSVDATNAARNFQAGATNQASLANAQLGTETSRANAQMTNEAAARTAEAANTADLAKLDAGTRMQLGQLDSGTRVQLGQLDADTRTKLAQMDNQTRTLLSTMENQYRQLLQANQGAASMYNQAVSAIGNISIQPNLTPTAKNSAIETQLNLLNEGLRATAEIAKKDADAISSLNLSQFFASDMQDGDAMKAAIADQRFDLQQAVRDAQAAIPVWGVAYESYKAPPGPRQSERTAANFQALYAQKYQEYQRRVQELDAFNRQNPK